MTTSKTTQLTVEQIADALHNLPNDQLLNLNRYLCGIIKNRNTVKRMQATVGFSVGDKVTFNDKSGRTVYATVAKVKRVMIACVETADSARPGMRWNVGSTLLRKA